MLWCDTEKLGGVPPLFSFRPLAHFSLASMVRHRNHALRAHGPTLATDGHMAVWVLVLASLALAAVTLHQVAGQVTDGCAGGSGTTPQRMASSLWTGFASPSSSTTLLMPLARRVKRVHRCGHGM